MIPNFVRREHVTQPADVTRTAKRVITTIAVLAWLYAAVTVLRLWR